MSQGFPKRDGKVTFVSSGSDVTRRRGKGIGFYCPACDLTLKDSIQYVDHIHSKQHLVAVDQPLKVPRASLVEVQERIKLLAARVDRPYNIHEAIRLQREKTSKNSGES